MVAGGDRLLSGVFYDPAAKRFPLRDDWLLSVAGHAALKWLMLAFWASCFAYGPRWRRGALNMVLIALVVSLVKHSSPFPCPWDLPEYGGSAQGGACLPAAHPLTGFALFGLYFSLHGTSPRAARAALAAAWLIGLVAGAVQVARGAHFASHVLWTAWTAWIVAWCADTLIHPETVRAGAVGSLKES